MYELYFLFNIGSNPKQNLLYLMIENLELMSSFNH